MNKVTQRANEIYPNTKWFVGGVPTIARTAFVRGWNECIGAVAAEIRSRLETLEFNVDYTTYYEFNRLLDLMETGQI